MKLTRISAAALALAMTASLAALAAQPETVTAPAAYQTQLYLNGEALDASGLPGAAPKLLPMRLLCEADGGYADWFQEDNEGFFYIADARFIVSFADLSVTLDGEPLEGVTATLTEGVTFLPADVLALARDVDVNVDSEPDVDRVDVSTPNGTPLVKLARSILEQAGCGANTKVNAEDLSMLLELEDGTLTSLAAFLPMMTSPDTLILAKVAQDKVDAVKEALEGYRQQQQDTFSWYLSHNLPKVENAKLVDKDGWVMLFIGEDSDKAVELFQAGLETLAE